MRTSPIGRISVLAILGIITSALVFPTSTAGAGERWERREDRCFDSQARNHTVHIHCFTLHKLRNDGNRNRDYWTLHHWGTARSKEGYALKIFRLRVYPHEDSPRILNWADWSPRDDKDKGNCTQISVGISYVASISWTHSICEQWDIGFFQRSPGRFQNIWRPGTEYVENSEREVAYAIAVVTQPGQKPRWHFRAFADVH